MGIPLILMLPLPSLSRTRHSTQLSSVPVIEDVTWRGYLSRNERMQQDQDPRPSVSAPQSGHVTRTNG